MGTIHNQLAGRDSDELSLVRAAKQGDDSAFEELVRRYDRNVFRIAQHITQNRGKMGSTRLAAQCFRPSVR